jgi:hypothetical protein
MRHVNLYAAIAVLVATMRHVNLYAAMTLILSR